MPSGMCLLFEESDPNPNPQHDAFRISVSGIHFFCISVVRSGTHRRALGSCLSPIQTDVPDVCSGPAGVPVGLCGPQSAVESYSGGELAG